MKLLGSTENKITKNENAENVSYIEITEVMFVHCNIINNHFQQNPRVLHTFFPKNIWFRIFMYRSMVYWSKFYTTRNKR